MLSTIVSVGEWCYGYIHDCCICTSFASGQYTDWLLPPALSATVYVHSHLLQSTASYNVPFNVPVPVTVVYVVVDGFMPSSNSTHTTTVLSTNCGPFRMVSIGGTTTTIIVVSACPLY